MPYSVSHDLRAPLRSIDGFSQALEEDYGDMIDEQGKHMLLRIRAAAQRMGQLIDSLLELSRITRGEFAARRVSLSVLVEEVAADLQTADPERDVEIMIAPDVEVEGDPSLLRVVIENLVGNAWKYTSKRERARIEFGTVTGSEGRTCFGRDDGAGFDMAYSSKLFGVFQRLHHTNEFEGTGVGLATVQRIVQRHGGRVWAEGVVDQGACFYFNLGPSDARQAEIA